MDGSAIGFPSMKVYQYKRTKIALFITLMCILLSGCTAHTINSNVNIGICINVLRV